MAFGFLKGGGGDEEPIQYSPEKAELFFKHARTAQDTGQFEYAMQNWLNGLQQDPRITAGLEGFVSTFRSFQETPGAKRGPSKDFYSGLKGKGPARDFVDALLEWMLKEGDVGRAVKAADLAGKVGAGDNGAWIATQAFKAVIGDKSPRKDYLVKLSMAFERLGKPDMAVRSAEEAYKIDQTDGDLAARIRSLAASATMAKGGYNNSGQEGGFRANIRDASKQRQLEEADRVVKSADTHERLIAAAEADHASRPTDVDAGKVLIKRLLDRGTPADEERSHELLLKFFEQTKQIGFKLEAEALRIRQQKRKVSKLREDAAAHPTEEVLKSIYDSERRVLLDLEIAWLKTKVEAYPTDLGVKYELGARYYEVEKYEDAIALFQEAQNDPKHRPNVLYYMGLAFLKLDWPDEAVGVLRQALENRETSAERHMDVRYALMDALQHKAEAEGSLAHAEEAEKIASSIAIQQMNYRDIRQRRETLKKLVARLKGS